MADLLETIIEAHGGLERWSQLDAVSVHGVNGGVLWALKGQAGAVDDVFVRASLHQERETMTGTYSRDPNQGGQRRERRWRASRIAC